MQEYSQNSHKYLLLAFNAKKRHTQPQQKSSLQLKPRKLQN